VSPSIEGVPPGPACNRSARREAARREEVPRKEFFPKAAGNPLIAHDSLQRMEGNGSHFGPFLAPERISDARMTHFGNHGARCDANAAFRRGVSWEILARRSISREKAPQRLENTFISRREMGWPRQPWTPNIWCSARAAVDAVADRPRPRSTRGCRRPARGTDFGAQAIEEI